MIAGVIGVGAVLALHVVGRVWGAEEDRHLDPEGPPP